MTSGLAATELGPEGFLRSDPDELSALLDSYGLSCVGTFAPVLLHDAGHDPLPDLAGRLDALVACGPTFSCLPRRPALTVIPL